MQAHQLQFFVPQSHVEHVKKAIFDIGAGQIGAYKHCAWQVLGTGQFIATETAKPAVGSCNIPEKVPEYLVVVFCDESCVEKVVQALVRAHPYEAPVYCVQPVTMGDMHACVGK